MLKFAIGHVMDHTADPLVVAAGGYAMSIMSAGADRLHILAFEPFDAGSHRAVRESITRHSRHDWTWLTRPGRYWKWRMRAAAIEMIDEAQQSGTLNQSWDAIFITSLMSAADLRAMLPEAMRSTPLILYMHENQAAYPEGQTDELAAERDLHLPLTNLTSVLAVDHVIWNSAWNRDSFVNGIERILRCGPDLTLPRDLHDRILAKSRIIWPPVEPPAGEDLVRPRSPCGRVLHNVAEGDGSGHDAAGVSSPRALGQQPIRVVWPHRWEHDKGPDDLLNIARRLSEPLNIRWTILGEQYRRIPPELATFRESFADRIDHMGFVPDRDAYWRHLASCDWVLATARHEFFGIAVVEAMLAGCLPWLPPRLSYPELLPEQASDLSPENPPCDAESVSAAIREHLTPAIAPNAVSRLDEAVTDAIAASPPERETGGV